MKSQILDSFVYLQIIWARLSVLDFMGFVLSEFVRKQMCQKQCFELAILFNEIMTFLSKLST